MKKELDPSVTYVQFPISLLRNLLIDKVKTLNQILHYGIYHFAVNMEFGLQAVADQITYDYYRGNLTSDLQVIIDHYVENERIILDEDKEGFDINGRFRPEEESNDILWLYDTDKRFKDLSIWYYKMSQTLKFFNLSASYSVFNEGMRIAKTIPEKEVFAMINVKVLFNYRNYDKTEKEIAQLAMYLGIRSILGKKQMYKTNKNMILARMFGYKNHKQLVGNLSPKLKDFYDKYAHRYHFDHIKTELELDWSIHTYADHIRGLYVGHGKSLTYEKLAMECELKKKAYRVSKLKEQKARAKKNIDNIFKNKMENDIPIPDKKIANNNKVTNKWTNNRKPNSNNAFDYKAFPEDPF